MESCPHDGKKGDFPSNIRRLGAQMALKGGMPTFCVTEMMCSASTHRSYDTTEKKRQTRDTAYYMECADYLTHPQQEQNIEEFLEELKPASHSIVEDRKYVCPYICAVP